MRAGRLRHIVSIESVSVSQDSYGSPTKTWTTLYRNVSASIEPLSGKDLFAAQQVNPEISTKIRMRYLSGITSAHRVKYGARVFEIASPPINFQERNIELQLMCVERL